MKSVPPFNGTVEERVENQSFDRFYGVAEMLNSTTKFVATFILAPGGVSLQAVPQNSTLYYYDFLAYDNDTGDPPVLESIDTAQIAVLGPLYHGIPPIDAGWQLVVRNPVYNVTNISHGSRNNFWGFVFIVQDVDAMMDANRIDEKTREKELDYLIYTTERATNKIFPIRYSVKSNPTQEELQHFIMTGTNRTVLRSRIRWYLCMRTTYHEPLLSRSVTVVIVVSAVISSIFVFLIGASVVLTCLREYDGRDHAPKMAPFAMAIIGPCSGELLWELAPDHMVQVSDRLAEVQWREIVRHRAYRGIQMHPYTTTIITRTVDAAVQLCFDILEELQAQPIDGPLRHILGEDGRLLIACTVHWCTDATVRVETVSGSMRYEGPDVVYGGRMWVFAAPNEVSISRAARDAAVNMRDTQVHPLGSVFIRGVAERQDLFTITDPQNKRLREASTLARGRKRQSVQMVASSMEGTLEGNPLSIGAELLARGGHYHSNNSMTSAEVNEVLPADSSMGAVESGGALRRASDALRGLKGPNQINVPSSLVELLPTDSLQPLQEGAGTSTPPRTPLASLTVRIMSDENSSKSRSSGRQKQGQNASSAERSLSGGRRCGEEERRGSKNFELGAGLTVTSPKLRDKRPHDGDFLTEALLHPKIPTSLDMHLRAVFEQQSVVLDLSYDSVRTIVFYFHSSFKLLLKPLAGPERSNIFRRFVSAFGVPRQNILEHLAVRCALRHIQQLEETRSLLWNCEQQMRLQMLMRRPDESSTGFGSSDNNFMNNDSMRDSASGSIT
ncbi:hypothetical protein DQ04_05191040 [Trypanosoma grayi]|uniref:hypothetical protein n=1 Tax=Trypanosoma grayi TaxID=71804 RepID=UPI0004F4040E|nr:hypothetical protein DQ04_05191040 [Trypanosoma grayi]KEG09458.1 hypothetical protein DQ04_05191040 [Trypanosoma grayi]